MELGRNEQYTENPARLNCPIILLAEFITVDDDNLRKASIKWQTKTFWSLFKAKKISLMQIPPSFRVHIIRNEEHHEKHRGYAVNRIFQDWGLLSIGQAGSPIISPETYPKRDTDKRNSALTKLRVSIPISQR
ncbi:hypothetical protein TNCV_4220671 [Trichonephila clavipes]|nr:hypothetical protein TNCV_4220671 [Trichonephila clavipes]